MEKNNVILKRAILIILTLFLFSDLCQAQNRFSIEASGGVAIPVGDFGKNSADAIEPHPEFGSDWIIGFAKEKSAFAKTGYFVDLSLGYRVSKVLSINMHIGRNSNPVDSETLSELRSQNGQFPHQIDHQDYNMDYVLPEVQLQKSFQSSQLKLMVAMGLTRLIHPKYVSYLEYINNPDLTVWKTVNEGEDPTSSLVRISTSFEQAIIKAFTIGISVSYNSARFDYIQTTSFVPGTPNPSFYDKIHTQTINLGISLGYHF